ncbi:MAG: crossover junction endodeoxyribonuclease RuvC [Bacteroidales bacterium]|nr:crossover junction endodeoxyribonuclease RuvC [Bacteroidales bacterium]
MRTDKIILGVDPGTNIMGYGIIYNKDKNIELITMDVLRLNKISDHKLKLKKIFETTLELIEKYKIDEFAIESQFFGKNVQSMLKLGRAQGVSIAAALHKNIPVFEYSPRKIKQSITGRGSASKEQVAAMLCNFLNIKEMPKFLDATDALAVALCHYFQKNNLSDNDTHYSSWKGFLSKNPDRVK